MSVAQLVVTNNTPALRSVYEASIQDDLLYDQ